jgi:hypothetical protein
MAGMSFLSFIATGVTLIDYNNNNASGPPPNPVTP